MSAGNVWSSRSTPQDYPTGSPVAPRAGKDHPPGFDRADRLAAQSFGMLSGAAHRLRRLEGWVCQETVTIGEPPSASASSAVVNVIDAPGSTLPTSPTPSPRTPRPFTSTRTSSAVDPLWFVSSHDPSS